MENVDVFSNADVHEVKKLRKASSLLEKCNLKEKTAGDKMFSFFNTVPGN